MDEGLVLGAPRDPKRLRTLRVDVELWENAARTLKDADLDVSKFIRIALASVVAAPAATLDTVRTFGRDYDNSVVAPPISRQ